MDIIEKSIKDKVVIVTGGTRGIGYATVKAFLDKGAKVALFGSRKETVDTALKSILEVNNNYQVLGFYPNLTNITEIKESVNEIISKWGKIDVLINNAGISDAKSIYDQEAENFKNILDINVQGVFNTSKVVAEVMRKEKSGVIINTSSVVSLYGQTTGSGYPTSKFAVNGLTKSLARELGKDGIRVNAVAPGIIKTDMVAVLDQNMIKAMEGTVPIGRLGESEDIANAFLFLASDMATYITGEILSVDGGIII